MNIALIVAGGKGLRMGGELPKQFLLLDEKPVFVRTIEAFLNHEDITAVIVGMNGEWLSYAENLVNEYMPGAENVCLIEGGASRQETLDLLVREAKKRYAIGDCDVLVSHDAVRPFVSKRLISESIGAAVAEGAAGAYIPASDTIVSSENGVQVSAMPDRSTMYQAQTPQTFQLGLYESVVNSLSEKEFEQVTDACKLFFLRGIQVAMVKGDVQNIKITHPMDYQIAKMMVKDLGGTNGPDVKC